VEVIRIWIIGAQNPWQYYKYLMTSIMKSFSSSLLRT
jgi:hypothetical protein